MPKKGFYRAEFIAGEEELVAKEVRSGGHGCSRWSTTASGRDDARCPGRRDGDAEQGEDSGRWSRLKRRARSVMDPAEARGGGVDNDCFGRDLEVVQGVVLSLSATAGMGFCNSTTLPFLILDSLSAWFLHVILYSAERAWSHAMEKRQLPNGPNGLLLFSQLCAVKADSRTSLEAESFQYLLHYQESDHVRVGYMTPEFIQGLISFPLDVPGTAYHRCLQGRRKAMKMLKNILQERREMPRKQQADFFDYVIEELKKEGTILTEAIALDLMFVLLFVSFETTSLALAYAMKLLSDHPLVLKQLQEEHEAIVKRREDPNSGVTWQEYKSMTDAQKQKFAAKGLNTQDLVALHAYRDGRPEQVVLLHVGAADGNITIAKDIFMLDDSASHKPVFNDDIQLAKSYLDSIHEQSSSRVEYWKCLQELSVRGDSLRNVDSARVSIPATLKYVGLSDKFVMSCSEAVVVSRNR
ncbi:Cytochrome P450 [Sesbania bispinosa]|nr:Cytochrome P450 [Sesbania bispinosa]